MDQLKIIEKLEPHIIDNGVVTIDSVFRFEDDPASLPGFLGLCKRRNCMVRFVNESLMCMPDGNLKPENNNGRCPTGFESMFTVAMMSYMTMYKEYFLKHMEYKLQLEKNEDWIVGSMEVK